MGNLTLADYKAAVNQKMEEIGTYVHFSGTNGIATVVSSINKAARRVAAETKCILKKTTFTTVANTREYNLPSDYYIYEGDITETSTGNRVKFAEVDKLDWTSSTGEPESFYVLCTLIAATTLAVAYTKQQIGFNPMPSAVYTEQMFYFALPRTMSVDADTCDIPDKYQDLVTAKSTAELLRIDRRYAEAQAFEQEVPKMVVDTEMVEEPTGVVSVRNVVFDPND